MNVIECSAVVFHSPAFVFSKNFGLNVEAKKFQGLRIFYNVSLRMLFLEYNGKIAFFDTFHSATPIDSDLLKQSSAIEIPQAKAPKAKGVQAQQ